MNGANIFMFVVAVLAQFLGIALLPATKGMTVLAPTAIVMAGFLIGAALLSRLMNAGAELGILIPLQAAILPLLTIAVGVVFYKEPATIMRISMLVGACVLIAASNFLPATK